MSVFKKASVTPIVKTVVSQGLENNNKELYDEFVALADKYHKIMLEAAQGFDQGYYQGLSEGFEIASEKMRSR